MPGDQASQRLLVRSGFADVFLELASKDAFWDTLASLELSEIVLSLEPGQSARMADEDYLDDIAAAFARVIDAKSPFTSGHSDRVALFTDMIAEEMGYDLAKRRWIKRAALLHDIGKLGVSNSILDKNGKLDGDEWEAMKDHAAIQKRSCRKSRFSQISRASPAPITSASTAKAIRAGFRAMRSASTPASFPQPTCSMR